MSDKFELKVAKMPEPVKDEWADPDHLLEHAKGVFQDVLIIGWNRENEQLQFFGDSKLTVAEMLYLVEMFKIVLIHPAMVDDE